ncbi:hypothetical protein ACHAXS_003126 [Conticribra weissflogii]
MRTMTNIPPRVPPPPPPPSLLCSSSCSSPEPSHRKRRRRSRHVSVSVSVSVSSLLAVAAAGRHCHLSFHGGGGKTTTCRAFPIVRTRTALRSSTFSRYDDWKPPDDDDIDDDDRAGLSATTSSPLDPLLTSFLLRAASTTTTTTTTPSSDLEPERDRPAFSVSDVSAATIGLRAWDACLTKGRLPSPDDFHFEVPFQFEVWPEEPLFSKTRDRLAELGLARLVRRHPEIATSVLLGVARMAVRFAEESRREVMLARGKDDEDGHDYFGLWDNDDDDDEDMSDEDTSREFSFRSLSPDEMDNLAKTMADNLAREWEGAVRGVSLLDEVFGYNHNLLDMQVHILYMQLAHIVHSIRFAKSFHIPQTRHNHTGKWRLRNPRRNMASSRLATSPDAATTSRLPPGTARSPIVIGLPYHIHWEGDAPISTSEAIDVQGRCPGRGTRSHGARFRFGSDAVGKFGNRASERGGVASFGEDQNAVVVFGQDGQREVVGRDCRIVSFSSANNAIDSGVLSCDAQGVRTLLDFLSYGFGGGTDVTGALTYALTALENDDLAASDLLLVTDGELPNPPVSNVVMARLDALRRHTGMEIHGLLVGRKESPALEALCDEVHDFLVDGDERFPLGPMGKKRSSTGVYYSSSPGTSKRIPPLTGIRGWTSRSNVGSIMGHRCRLALGSTGVVTDDEDMDHVEMETRCLKKDRRSGSKRNRFHDDDNDDDDWPVYDDLDTGGGGGSSSSSNTRAEKTETTQKSEYVTRVEDSLDDIRTTAKESILSDAGAVEDLRNEIAHESSLWSQSHILSDAISFIESGLVERDVEARLVVLAMVSQEHVLFVGPPGTSKSVLSAKLARLCGGPFFQRLFTRFTTPEELFGPLSLRALENDEYVRCIDGFLPTASVAFLDEIFKANSAILNTLLTILNERMFDNGAGTRVACPLKCVIGASNELPDTEELDALLDRFLLRAQVNPVSDAGLIRLLSQSSSAGNNLNDDDVVTSNTMASDLETLVTDVNCSLGKITMDESICILIRDLRTFVRDELGVYISDRRLVKAARLLRVSAATHGRSRVDYVDCLLLQHILWQVPEQRLAIREWLLDHINPGESIVEQSKFLFRGIASEAASVVKTTMGDVTGELGARESDIESIGSIRSEIKGIRKMLERQRYDILRHILLLERLPEHLWLGIDEALAAKQHLLPLAKSTADAVTDALVDVTSLDMVLSSQVENDLRSSLLDILLESGDDAMAFTYDELNLSLKEAKKKFDGATLRKWKRAKRDLIP